MFSTPLRQLRRSSGDSATEVFRALALFDRRAWLLVLVAAVAAALLIGLPTAMIKNPWFTRMTSVRPQDYLILAVTAALSGLIGGTFATGPAPGGGQSRALAGGGLSLLAVGCPVCNKLVVLLLGTSGALTLFAPLQFYLGVASLALLVWTLRLRARSLVVSCEIMPEAA